MAKQRYNNKKIANTPSLKKAMARFCAQMMVKYNKPNYEELLYKGHRGFISFSEEDLAKEFDKQLMILRDKHTEIVEIDNEFYKKTFSQINVRQPYSYERTELERFYQEGIKIANDVFEDKFLA